MSILWFVMGVLAGMGLVAVLSWLTDREFDGMPPRALTDDQAYRLEKAIRAKGYRVLYDPETQDIKLEATR